MAHLETTDWPSNSARSLEEALTSYTDVCSVQAKVKQSLTSQGTTVALSYTVRPEQVIPEGDPPRHWSNKKYQQPQPDPALGEFSRGEESGDKGTTALETSTPEATSSPAMDEPGKETEAEKQKTPAKAGQQKETEAEKKQKKTPAKASQQKETEAEKQKKTPAKASQQKETEAEKKQKKTPAKASQQKETEAEKKQKKTPAKAGQQKETEAEKKSASEADEAPHAQPSEGEGAGGEVLESEADIFLTFPVEEEEVEEAGREAEKNAGGQTEEEKEEEEEEFRLLPELPPLPAHPLPPVAVQGHFLASQEESQGASWRPEDRARVDSYLERMDRLAAEGEAVMKSFGETSIYFRRESNKTLTEIRKISKAAQAEKEALTQTRRMYDEAVNKVEGTRARYDEAVAKVESSAQKIVRCVRSAGLNAPHEIISFSPPFFPTRAGSQTTLRQLGKATQDTRWPACSRRRRNKSKNSRASWPTP